MILIFITIFTFIMLPGIKNPPASDDRRQRQPGHGVQRALRLHGPAAAAQGQREPEHSRVDGQQYVWRFQYPKQGDQPEVFSYVDMVVPVGMTVTLDITADDVIHSWWIPKLGGKMDAVPGYTNKTWFQIPRVRDPRGQEPGRLSRASAPSCAAATTPTCSAA